MNRHKQLEDSELELKWDRNRRRVKQCPCGRNNNDGKFAPFVGYEKNGYCFSCGKSFLPESKKADNEYFPNFRYQMPKPIEYISSEYYQQFIEASDDNSFCKFLYMQFGVDIAMQVIKKYAIGTSKYWRGAVTFPLIDINGNIRQIKVMDYDPISGKRKKSEHVSWKLNAQSGGYFKDINGTDKIFFMGKSILGHSANLRLCFFGEHLLKNTLSPIAIVESEKSALVASIYLPEFTWIATGGMFGCKWDEYETYKVLKGRDVVFYPDLNALDTWRKKSQKLDAIVRSLHFSDLIERKATAQEKTDKLDIADYLLNINIKEFQKNK